MNAFSLTNKKLTSNIPKWMPNHDPEHYGKKNCSGLWFSTYFLKIWSKPSFFVARWLSLRCLITFESTVCWNWSKQLQTKNLQAYGAARNYTKPKNESNTLASLRYCSSVCFCRCPFIIVGSKFTTFPASIALRYWARNVRSSAWNNSDMNVEKKKCIY